MKIKIDPKTGEKYISFPLKGRPLIMNPFTNKGTAFTMEERDELNLHGLVPPCKCNMEQQLKRTYESFLSQTTDLEKYIYLTSLHDRNETLFFLLLHEHIEEMMPIVYTPVVGEACQKFSHIYRKPQGLYIGYDQRDKIEQILSNAPFKNAAIIVATDGERILGLGDQGAGGMGISIGKLCLYTLCGAIAPYKTLPIMLDVGTNNEERLNDPLYLGLKQHRVVGEEYQNFIDRFVAAVKKVYPNILLQWEDLLKENAIKQLHRFQDKLCTFNDDIQGTAGVVLSGIMSGLRITKKPLTEQRILLAGAGASAQGIADLITAGLVEAGLNETQAQKHIWMVDSQGLVLKDRSNLSGFKKTYARDPQEIVSFQCKDRSKIQLEEAILNIKPTILLGTSGTPGVFTKEIIGAMAELNERPMIFPLSNPTSKAECTAEHAIQWSQGRAIVATGSPFAPVTYQGKYFRIGQCNNSYIFPGVGLGVTAGHVRRVTNGMFLTAAHELAHMLTNKDLEEVSLFPSLARIRDCSFAIACAVIRKAVEEGHADASILNNLEETVRNEMWEPRYLPIKYEPI